MQELEKILEEIDREKEKCLGVVKVEIDPMEITIHREQYKGLRMAEDIIRKHMNDGWIPVDERLPDNNENVLVTTDMGLIASGYIAHGTWITDQEPDHPIAWRPFPEPYRPERSEVE